MPDIFFMFVLFAMLFVIGVGLLILYIVDQFTDLGKKAVFGAAIVYLVERFKK